MKVFISHSSSDKSFVRTLKHDLSINGIQTFVDEDCLELGDSLKEKLEEAIDESTHFIIILSDNSIKSEWVQFELTEALSLLKKKTLTKVIPIKYRKCEIPVQLAGFLYGDISDDILKIENNKIKFLTAGYDNLLFRLIKTINSSSNILTTNDKVEIKKETQKAEIKINDHSKKELIFKHRILNFKNSTVTKKYVDIVSTSLPPHGAIKIYPVLLPSMYKLILNDIKRGDKIKFILNEKKSVVCYFAGFRLSQSHIVVQQVVREILNIEIGQEYTFLINIVDKTFKLL